MKARDVERWIAARLLPASKEHPSLVGPFSQRTRELRVLGRRVRIHWRDPTEPMGRFGGGWQIEAGVMIGGSTVIVNLGLFSVRVDRRRRAR